jgi:hypothetical protein
MATKSETAASLPRLWGGGLPLRRQCSGAGRKAAAAEAPRYAFFATGTGTPAIFTLNEPRLARVQK